VNQTWRRCLHGEVAREHLRRQRSPASTRSPRSTGTGPAVPVDIHQFVALNQTYPKDQNWELKLVGGPFPARGGDQRHPKDSKLGKCYIFDCLATVLITGINEPISSFLHSENKDKPTHLSFSYIGNF
jgi:hypothetical protein